MRYAFAHDFVKAFSITTITYLSKFDKNDTRVSIVTALNQGSEQGKASGRGMGTG
jgi:hypothetical protein